MKHAFVFGVQEALRAWREQQEAFCHAVKEELERLQAQRQVMAVP
jgi:hypothetical protein